MASVPLCIVTARDRDIFQAHWIDVIRTGETAGKMGVVLVDLVQQIRESRETRRKVTAALLYPIILVVVITGAAHGSPEVAVFAGASANDIVAAAGRQ